MKIAVTATGPGLDDAVDPRFGRCACFVFVDTETDDVETVPNENLAGAGGVGIQSAQLVAEKGAGVVLTGNCGPNAYRTLEAAGIALIVGVGGTVRDAVAQYKAGELSSADEPNVDAKFGA